MRPTPRLAHIGPARAGILALLALAPLKFALAETLPAADQTLRLHWQQGFNLHGPGPHGAQHTNDSGEVSLTLRHDHRSAATDIGKRIESILAQDWYTQTTTEWTTAWDGTWRIARGQLLLTLAHHQHACAKIIEERRGAQQFLPRKEECHAGPTRLVLVCDESSVQLDAAGAAPTQRSARAWVCRPASATASVTAGAPFPWVFGRERCLTSTGGGRFSHGLNYAACVS